MTAEQRMDQAATVALRAVSDEIDRDYCPTVELIQAVRKFNSSLARLMRRHGLAINEDGRIYSAGPGQGPSVA